MPLTAKGDLLTQAQQLISTVPSQSNPFNTITAILAIVSVFNSQTPQDDFDMTVEPQTAQLLGYQVIFYYIIYNKLLHFSKTLVV